MAARYKLAPSILSADFARLGEEVARIEKYADLLHVDAMDGHFVPPITIGPVVVKALRAVTSLPLECHLMVTDPLGQTEQFAEAGATSVVAHIEASPDPEPVIERARSLGLGVGISLNPPTPLDAVLPYLERVDVLNVMTVNPGWAGQRFIRDVLPKIEAARAEIDRRGLDVAIAVDGGIDLETGRDALDAGANVLGAASAIFSRPDPAEAARALKELLNEREANA
ncbi:MAG: ribulose-phosphate 3-epimerase [Actinobacteria bacterium]|nr:MAG: ribulose-phosphate 3-epimerase [Actinomycetota bacterium]